MKNIIVASVLLSLTTFAAPPQHPKQLPEHSLTRTELEAHLRFLASDELRGRMTGEPGNEAAARYLAEYFRAAGLDTLPGADGYLQRIEFERVTPPKRGAITLGNDTLEIGRDFFVTNRRFGHVKAPVVFAGYGLTGEVEGKESGADLEGKIVVTEFGAEGEAGVRAGFSLMRARRRHTEQLGAAAVIELYSGGLPWSRLARFYNKADLILAQDAVDSGKFIHVLLNDQDGVYARLFQQSPPGYLEIDTRDGKSERVYSSNVVAQVRGSDPILRRQYVALTAHYDHVGTIPADGSSAQADTIRNGARDNGMGTVALMAAAKSLAAQPPARSVIVIATTAEEMGLYGSEYYVENPLVPLAQTVFVLNNDGAGYNDTTAATVFGMERTNVAEVIRTACAAFGLRATIDPIPEQRIFERSDNINFARKGIPAPTFSPGVSAWDHTLSSKYHQVNDEVDEEFDFEYFVKFCQAYAHAARLIADFEQTPRWLPGDEFEAPALQLYGGE